MFDLLPHRGGNLRVSEPTGVFAPAEVLSQVGPLAQSSAELRALAGERNPGLFYEGLFGYAGRLQRQGHADQSQAILQIVANGPEAALARRARERLQALQGGGSFGARAEFLLGRFAQEATEPAALFAMGGAGALYRVSRLAFLTRLSVNSAGVLTRGFGARALASSLAFTVEAGSFPFLMRAGHAALGRNQEWSRDLLGREIASSFLVLGGLKLAGAAAGSALLYCGNRPAWIAPVLRQGAMLSGIMAGHRLEEWVGLRSAQDGAFGLVDGLALLLQFNVAGRLSQRLFGEGFQAWERDLDRRSQSLEYSRSRIGSPIRAPGLLEPHLAMAALEPQVGPDFGIMTMQNSSATGGGNQVSGPRLPKMGLRDPAEVSSMAERLNRQEGERVLRRLMSQSLSIERLEQTGITEGLLNAFGVTAHSFDVQALRDGFRIARRYPERVARLAFDFDEVTLHWAFSPRDLFSVMARGAESAYYHTPSQVLEQESMPESQGFNGLERIWFQGVQRLFPMAFRQHLQFHPGMRAFQLGLRLGQDQNLIMVTVGQAGRLMRLANEDPALKMIYFGRLPTEEINITEVRGATNLYTREDFVQALRSAETGEIRFPGNSAVESYFETLRRHPQAGDRLKHPALALLRGKRPFDALVDDSSFALEVLGSLPGFTVFQVPSARPARTKNFTLGSPDAYLRRSANGYVADLARRLESPEWSSGPLENRPAPEGYPFQRMDIEIPWTKFGSGYRALGKEARARGRSVSEGKALAALPFSTEPSREPLSMSDSQVRLMVERLYREFDILLDGRAGEVSIEAGNTLMLKELALESPENFQATLDSYFTAEEQGLLPQRSRPLAERGAKFYSRISSLMAAKTAVCNLLGLDVAEHAREVRFRFGRPLLTGMAAHRLNGNSLLTTLSDDGEVGVGIALIEPSPWASGLVGIGVDLTTNRVSYATPERHSLAEAAFKAAFPGHIYRQFNHYRTAELQSTPAGGYALTGQSMRAGRSIRGDQGIEKPLPIRGLSFQVGRATVGLVAIPALNPSSGSFRPQPANFPYRIDSDGRYQLPRPGMTVAVLGDVNATRTLQLVRNGHYVLHIERDPEMAELAERLVWQVLRDEGTSIGDVSHSAVLRADWYDSGTNADLVEAYFPLNSADLPGRRYGGRREAIEEFLEKALNSKLVNGGSAFVVSEFRENIEDMAEVVRSRPNLQLLDVQFEARKPPLIGGFSVSGMDRQRVHYLVYRKIGDELR